ncbi:DJ-1/PfpI family protein [soil metagenome]
MPDPSPIRIVFLLFPNVTQLDLTGPAQVLSRLGNATIDLVAGSMAPVKTDAGFCLTPTTTFGTTPAADILCIPGGFGIQDAMEDDGAIAWVREAAAGATWVTSVCTGALFLGAAGLLKGYRATTHWASHHHLASFGAIPVKERVVFDRNRVTGGGVTAGIDFGIALTAAIRGEEHARLVQLSLEYDPKPPYACGSPDCASEATLEKYRELAAKAAPNRDARTEKAAAKMRRDFG